MRGYVSASLDGELSEVGRARLDTHLASCADCRAYAADVEVAAHLVRSTPLEELGFRIALPSRRLAWARKLQVTAAAAGVAAVIGLSAVAGSSGEGVRSSAAGSTGSVQQTSMRFPENELRMLYRASLRNEAQGHARLAL